jgi:hypothetical protein
LGRIRPKTTKRVFENRSRGRKEAPTPSVRGRSVVGKSLLRAAATMKGTFHTEVAPKNRTFGACDFLGRRLRKATARKARTTGRHPRLRFLWCCFVPAGRIRVIDQRLGFGEKQMGENPVLPPNLAEVAALERW